MLPHPLAQEGGMQITVRTEAEAERIVADVWLALERTSLPSPDVTCKPRPPCLIVEFQFAQQIHEEILCEALLASHGHACEPEPLG